MTKLDTREGCKVMEGLDFLLGAWDASRTRRDGLTASALHPSPGSVKFSIWRGWQSLQPCPSGSGYSLQGTEICDGLSCRRQVSFTLACVLCQLPGHMEQSEEKRDQQCLNLSLQRHRWYEETRIYAQGLLPLPSQRAVMTQNMASPLPMIHFSKASQC